MPDDQLLQILFESLPAGTVKSAPGASPRSSAAVPLGPTLDPSGERDDRTEESVDDEATPPTVLAVGGDSRPTADQLLRAMRPRRPVERAVPAEAPASAWADPAAGAMVAATAVSKVENDGDAADPLPAPPPPPPRFEVPPRPPRALGDAESTGAVYTADLLSSVAKERARRDEGVRRQAEPVAAESAAEGLGAGEQARRLEAERAAAERATLERLAAERAAAERAAAERAQRAEAERQQVAAERAAAERVAADRAALQRIAAKAAQTSTGTAGWEDEPIQVVEEPRTSREASVVKPTAGWVVGARGAADAHAAAPTPGKKPPTGRRLDGVPVRSGALDVDFLDEVAEPAAPRVMQRVPIQGLDVPPAEAVAAPVPAVSHWRTGVALMGLGVVLAWLLFLAMQQDLARIPAVGGGLP